MLTGYFWCVRLVQLSGSVGQGPEGPEGHHPASESHTRFAQGLSLTSASRHGSGKDSAIPIHLLPSVVVTWGLTQPAEHFH